VSGTTPYPVAARELLRNSLLDAAVARLGQQARGRLVMADIAAAAGVSRQTLYNEFGSRGEFIEALVLREVDRFIEPVARSIQAHTDDPAIAVAEALSVFFASAATHPLIGTIISGDGTDELLRRFTTEGGPMLRRAVQRLSEILGDGWPEVSVADIEPFSECMVRLAVSLAALPDSPAGMGPDVIARMFTPYIEEIVGKARQAAGGLGISQAEVER
jgi:AcrR family transcriptional regulator